MSMKPLLTAEEETALEKFLVIESVRLSVGLTQSLSCDKKIVDSLEEKGYIKWNELKTRFVLTEKARILLGGPSS